MFDLVSKHYCFNPQGKAVLNLKDWRQVLRALCRAHQQGEQIPLSVWSVCNLISLALEPLQSESEQSVRAVNAELNDENENKEETRKILGERPHSHESPTGRYESLGTLHIESLFPE